MIKHHAFRKAVQTTIASFILIGLVAGCGAAQSDGKTVIRVGTWEGDTAYQLQQDVAKKYMESHPNVTIKIESVPDQYGTKILTEIAGGQAPDIYQVGDGDVSTFQGKGALEDLTPYIEKTKDFNTDDFLKNILDVGKINGKYYTLPKDYSTLGVYYNKDMFDKAGIAYPTDDWTWDDFTEAARKLTIKDGDSYSQWGVKLPGAEIRPVLPFVYSYGGDVISEDGKKVEGYMNSDGTKQGVELFNTLFNKDGIAPSTADSDSFNGADLFISNKVAMYITGIWPSSNYVDAKMNFGIVKLPKGPAGQFSTIYYSGYGIYSQSKNKDAAWDYLNYLSTEGQQTFVDYALSAYVPAIEENGQDEDPAKAVFVDSVDIARMFPERYNPNFSKTAGQQFLNVLTEITTAGDDGNLNISKMLDDAAAQGQKEMDSAE